jgi:hypothetical protein
MANKKIPMRQCVGCREMKAKRDMIRVIKTQSEDGTDVILLDATGKKNGRGAYLCPNRTCLQAAVKSKGLERSFQMPIPKDVYEILTKEMEELEAR